MATQINTETASSNNLDISATTNTLPTGGAAFDGVLMFIDNPSGTDLIYWTNTTGREVKGLRFEFGSTGTSARKLKLNSQTVTFTPYIHSIATSVDRQDEATASIRTIEFPAGTVKTNYLDIVVEMPELRVPTGATVSLVAFCPTIGITGTHTGAFIKDESVTQTTSGAYGTVVAQLSGRLSLIPTIGSAAFTATSGHTLTGSPSGKTMTLGGSEVLEKDDSIRFGLVSIFEYGDNITSWNGREVSVSSNDFPQVDATEVGGQTPLSASDVQGGRY